MRYDDKRHIGRLEQGGEYPKIHDGIFKVIKEEEEEREHMAGAIDLGASIGLLSARLLRENIFNYIVAVEGNKNSATQIKKVKEIVDAGNRLEIENFYIKKGTLRRVASLAKDKGVKSVVARRVFPEISKQYDGIVKDMSKIFYDAGIDRIYIQGRIATSNSVNCLGDAKKEAIEFSEHYLMEEKKSDIIILRRR